MPTIVANALTAATSGLTAAGISSAGASAGTLVYPIIYTKVGAGGVANNLVVLYNAAKQIMAQFTGAAADLFIGSHGINIITAGPGSLATNGAPPFLYLSSATTQTTTAASSAVSKGVTLTTTSGTSASSAAVVGGIAASTIVLLVILIIIAIIIVIQLREKIERWFGEECKLFLFHYPHK